MGMQKELGLADDVRRPTRIWGEFCRFENGASLKMSAEELAEEAARRHIWACQMPGIYYIPGIDR